MEFFKSVMLILVAVIGVALATPKSEAAQEILNIVNDPKLYNKAIVPYPNRSGPLDVYTTMYLRNLDVDDVNMRINVDLTFRMIWQDARLSYSAPGISVRFSDVSKFWIPDVFFRDSFETTQMKTIYPEEFIQITNKGEVLYSTRFILNLKCAMDLSRFPHDIQTCFIKFASYGFSSKDIVFHFKDENSLYFSDTFMISDRFSVEKVESGDCAVQTSTGTYSCLQASVTIDRLFGSYLLEWYMPCICFVVIAFCSEFMDASSLLPRLVLTVGPLLALSACSLTFNEALASVPYVRAFDLFNGISILVIFATVIHVIISYYYHAKPVDEEPKPDVEAVTKMQRLCKKLREKANQITRAVIIGFYFTFIFLYFLAYST